MKRPYEVIVDSYPPPKRIKISTIDWQDYYIG
jgi:hypothetical protein